MEPEPTGLPLDKLLQSLESGYPNEVDFAMNMLLIISHQGDIVIDKVCDSLVRERERVGRNH